MKDARFYQDLLLEEADRKFGEISPRTKEAFLRTPRHQFVPRFSVDYESWLVNTPENYPLIYADSTLMLYADGEFVSTISQPSFVLKMLDLLDLHPGQKTFELGAGSGWNAALMGELVGPDGTVASFEIIPEMASQAQSNIEKLNIKNVVVHQGDAIQGFREGAPFDRGIFTAGSRDFPVFLLEGIKEGGILLFVLATKVGDVLLCLRKTAGHFETFRRIRCRFVKVTGPEAPDYEEDLSPIAETNFPISIYPKGKAPVGGRILPGKDVDFFIGQ